MLVLGTLMIPDQLRLVPIYLMLVNWIPGWVGHLGWHDASFVNRNGVILIQLVSATSLFLMRQYFLTIPRDLEEAAKLDAAGYFKTYRKVMLPLAGPALAAVGILTFQGTWNALFWPAVLLQDKSAVHDSTRYCALPVRLPTFWPPLMAASVVAILPDPRDLRPLPAVLRRRRRRGGGEGMTLRRALGVAANDLYHQAWRLMVLNVLLGRRRARGRAREPGRALCDRPGRSDRPRPGGGHALRRDAGQTEDLRLVELPNGLRRHWRHGIVLGVALAIAVAARGRVSSPSTHGQEPGPGPLQPLASTSCSCSASSSSPSGRSPSSRWARPLRAVARDAALAVARRPLGFLGLALALLLVNVVGVAAAILPFLTLTISYSFLVSAALRAAEEPSAGGLSSWQALRTTTSRRPSATPPRSTTSCSRSRTVSSWCSSARPAAARPRPCACLPAWRRCPTGGSSIGDRVVNNVAPQHRDIAMVFQSYALYPHMTVYDNLAFGLRNQRVPKKEIDSRVQRAAEHPGSRCR